MPLQRPNPDPRKDVILELGLRGGRGYRGVSVGFDGKAAGLCLQRRHDRAAWQLSKAMSGRPDWHAAKLPGASGAIACSVMPGGSDRYATELRAAGTHQVPGWPDRHPAELQGSSASDAADVSCRYDGHTAELQSRNNGTADLSGGNDGHAAELCGYSGDMPGWPDRHPAKLQGRSAHNAADLSDRHDGHATELQGESAADMPCRYDRYAAELPCEPATDMSCRYHGHAAELSG